MKSKRGSSQIYQVNLFGFCIQANEGKTSGGDLPQAAQLTIRLIQIFNTLEWAVGEGSCEEDKVREGRQAVVDFVHGRADQSACQGELMISSKIFFAGFELLTFVLK